MTADPRPLLVFGADSLLGEAVVRDALLRSLPVRSGAEDTSRVARIGPGQQILALAPGDERTLAEAADGVRAAVFAAGPEGADGSAERRGSADPTESTVAALRALRRAGVRRVVAASSTALHGGAAAPVLPRGSGSGPRADHLLLEASGADWTVLRAGRLTDLLGTRKPMLLAAEQGARVPASRRIPREDLARALVDQALVPGQDPRVLVVAAEG
jgi:nucleoside-diphosphate-sugar epimerase